MQHQPSLLGRFSGLNDYSTDMEVNVFLSFLSDGMNKENSLFQESTN